MGAAYTIESWSPEGRAAHREISQRRGGIRGHLDLFIQPEACADRSIGKTCEWCDTREAAIEVMLIGIGRELAQWQPFEHVHFFRDEHDATWAPRTCSCGAIDALDTSAVFERFERGLFWVCERWSWQSITWTARPGTTVEVRTP